jgi:selenocysteine lyase/cysteine desulfurase
LSESGGVVRAGISRYIEETDVQRLLDVVARLASA